jgi:hypothetical protein
MLGRRSHARVSIAAGAEGVLSLPRDIAIRAAEDGQLVAISREPGVLGEIVLLALPDEGVNIVVEIIESQPIVTDGAVRHRLSLRRSSVEDDATDANQIDQGR